MVKTSESVTGPPTGKVSQRLFRQLVEELESSDMVPGHQFYTITEICERFDVSATTAVKCLDRLVEQGLLVRRQGSGTYVSHGREVAEKLREVRMAGPRCLDYVMPEDIDARAGVEYLSDLLFSVQGDGEDGEMALRVNLLPIRLKSRDGVRAWFEQRLEGGAQAFVFRWMPRLAQEVAQESNLPVCVHGHPDANVDLPFVDLDQAAFGEAVASYLKDQKCKRIGLLMRAEWRTGDTLMVNSLLKSLGSRLASIETCPPFDDDVDAAVERLLSKEHDLDALVVRNHPGSWLPRHLHEVKAERSPFPVLCEWNWHPMVTQVVADGPTVIDGLANMLRDITTGRRMKGRSIELPVQIDEH